MLLLLHSKKTCRAHGCEHWLHSRKRGTAKRRTTMALSSKGPQNSLSFFVSTVYF